MDQDKKEMCTIRIMFPVTSDDEAIDYKKKIAEVLSNNPDAQLHFALVPAIPKSPQG